MDASVQQQSLRATQHQFNRVLIIVFILSMLLVCYDYDSITSLLHRLQQFLPRNAMFAFCNVILLFLIRDSGLLHSFTASADKHFEDCNIRSSQVEEDGVKLETTQVNLAESEVVVEQGDRWDGAEMELVVFEECEVLGTEELNMKCEEFIGRVKRERILEAKRIVKV